MKLLSCLTLTVLTLLLVMGADAQVDTYPDTFQDYSTGELIFESTGQSLRESGPEQVYPGPQEAGRWSDFTYNSVEASSTVGEVFDLTDIGLGAYGAEFTAGLTQFNITPIVELDALSSGSVHVKYPLESELEHPKDKTFSRGSVIAVFTDIHDLDNGFLRTTSPHIEARLGIEFLMFFGYAGSFCFFDCVDLGESCIGEDDDCVVEHVPIIDPIELPALDVIRIAGEGDPDPQRVFLDGADALGFEIPYEVHTNVELVTGISGRFNTTLFDIESSSYTSIGDSGRNLRGLHGGGHTDFLDALGIDMTGVFKIPTNAAIDLSELPLGITGGYDLGTAVLRLSGDRATNVNFDPHGRLTFEFSRQARWASAPPGEYPPPDFPPGLSSPELEAQIDAGDVLYVEIPDDDEETFTITPVVTLGGAGGNSSTFENNTYNTWIPGVDVSFGSLSIGGEFPDPVGTIEWTIGPLIEFEITEDPDEESVLDHESWALGGFTEQAGDPIVMEAENPVVTVIKETSRVENLGRGVRVIDYLFQIRNDGNVDLHHVQLEEDLAVAFADAVDWSLDEVWSCDLDLNPNYDGAADIQMLTDSPEVDNGGNTLVVGAVTYVGVTVTVTPGPSPFPGDEPFLFSNPITASGVSPIQEPYIPDGTFVSAEDLAVVNLGPVQVFSIDDFLFYSDNLIKLEGMADSFGTIGSNGDILYTERDSGVLAGDIRAQGDVIMDDQSAEADNVFTGGNIVLIGPSASLITYGKVEENFAFDGYPMAEVEVFSEKNDVTVGRGEVLRLAPGVYRHVVANTDSRIIFSSGVYDMSSFEARRLSTVEFDPAEGPVVINAIKHFFLNHYVTSVMAPPPTSTRDVIISVFEEGNEGSKGQISIGQFSNLYGTLNTPNGKIRMKKNSHLEGAGYGRYIELYHKASARYHDDGYGPLFTEIDTDFNGVPDCLEGGSAGVFQLLPHLRF